MTVRGLARGERAALLVNECQNAMVHPDFGGRDGLVGEVAGRGVLPRIARLADTCRRRGVLVVHSTIVMRADGLGTQSSSLLIGAFAKNRVCVEGSRAAEIHAGIRVHEADYVSRRLHGLSPFHGTELESVLRQRGVQTVIVTGVSTNVGVPGTCLEALNRGFTAVVPEDCVAGSSREIHDFQIAHIIPLLATVTTAAEVSAALAAAPAA